MQSRCAVPIAQKLKCHVVTGNTRPAADERCRQLLGAKECDPSEARMNHEGHG